MMETEKPAETVFESVRRLTGKLEELSGDLLSIQNKLECEGESKGMENLGSPTLSDYLDRLHELVSIANARVQGILANLGE